MVEESAPVLPPAEGAGAGGGGGGGTDSEEDDDAGAEEYDAREDDLDPHHYDDYTDNAHLARLRD